MAFLSIIVPVYNKEKYLDNCIQSILTQTFSDFELILINDGSTDNSGLKCDYYKNNNKRVVVFHQENQGVSAARNKGLEIATGEYIGFIDADDRIESNMYQTLIDNALSTNSDISICRLRQPNAKKSVNADEQQIKILERNEGLTAFLKGDLDFSANNKIYKKEIARKIKFEGQMFEDVFYTFQAISLSRKNVVVQNEFYHYLISDNSASVSKFNKKYMQPIYVTKKIVNAISEGIKEHVEYAKVLDLIMNISLLNLILLSGKSKHEQEYKMVVSNLKEYAGFLKTTKTVKTKHRVAYSIFRISPVIYTQAIKLYCLMANTDAIKRA